MRLNSLRVKLFLAIAGGTAALALGAYFVFSWSFERGFVEYVNKADEARLEPLVERLAQGYGREGGWRWVAEDRRRCAEAGMDGFLCKPFNRTQLVEALST